MSVRINRNIIQMTRGDTLLAQVKINVSTDSGVEPYEPQEGDTVRFALKHNTMNLAKTEYTDTDPLILKDIPIDTLILALDPEDTKNLGFGEYVYDIQITLADGTVDTFIAEGRFVLKPEVQ